jgi:hypothetical protein
LDGLLLKLLEDPTGAPGRWFWKLFQLIRKDLDRLFWCFPSQPWMGAPDGFAEDESAAAPFDGDGQTSVMLWRPGSLGQYAHRFAEEFIELWGIEPTRDDPHQLAARYNTATPSEGGEILRHHARVWLLYTDSTCWEIYARKGSLLDATRAHLWGKPWVQVYESHADRRAAAFRTAGLSQVWAAMNGGRAEPAAAAHDCRDPVSPKSKDSRRRRR